MVNVLEMKQRASELKNEISKALKDCEDGTITVAELSEKMDKAEKEDAEIATGIKAYNRAIAWRSNAADRGDIEDGAPPMEPGVQQKQLRANLAQYKQLQEKALANMKSVGDGRGHFHFDINVRHANGLVMGPDGIVHKDGPTPAQGIAGMLGEQTSGTTSPPTGVLDPDTYFYGGTAGPTVEPQFIPGIAELRWYPNVVASLFPTFPVSSPIVSYVRETTGDDDWQADATKEGATKPTSGADVERYAENVGKITNLMRVTDEVIQDAPYFWSLVQRRGVMGVSRKEEVELLAGAGLPGVHGLLRRSAVESGKSYPSGFHTPQTVSALTNIVIGGAAGAGAKSSTIASLTPGRKVGAADGYAATHGISIAEAVLQALYDIRVAHFFEPDAVMFNPLDWMTVRLAKDKNGQYLGGSFFGTNYGQSQDGGAVGLDENLSLWSKRVVSTPAQPEKLFLAGAFGDAGQILRLGALRTDITNTNREDFEQNLWTLRIEERVGLLIERPELFELVQIPTSGS